MTRVMFEWGDHGLRSLAPKCAVLVVVDVLSFSTACAVATSGGARVLPLRWRDERAARLADEAGAVLAGPRSTDTWSLSPASLLDLGPGTLFALPSPNGAALCVAAAESGAAVFTGCLRNATAVGHAAEQAAEGATIGIVAAGERWGGQDGPLRPAIEDQLGAGAIIAALSDAVTRFPEAEVVECGYRAVRRLEPLLIGSTSGHELHEWGFGRDVALAAELDVSDTAPRWRDGVLERE